jgi:RNA polymerase sigma-70 factor (ECF subfamily)
MIGPEPFETFVRTHQDMVYATAIRLLGSAQEAEDIAQHVFLKAFQRFGAVPANDEAAAWLRTVTRNACLNHLTRYRRRWRLFSEIDAPGDDAGGETFESSLVAPAASSAADAADEHARLEVALRALPDHQRVPLVLFHFEQASYQEIADALRVSVGKVKTDIHRGREALKRQLVQVHGTRRG